MPEPPVAGANVHGQQNRPPVQAMGQRAPCWGSWWWKGVVDAITAWQDDFFFFLVPNTEPTHRLQIAAACRSSSKEHDLALVYLSHLFHLPCSRDWSVVEVPGLSCIAYCSSCILDVRYWKKMSSCIRHFVGPRYE